MEYTILGSIYTTLFSYERGIIMAKKKISATRQAFLKERNRIKNYLRTLKKRGAIELPQIAEDISKIPERVTKKMVEDLRYWSAIRLRSASKFLDTESGVIRTGQEIRGEELQRPIKKAKEKKVLERKKKTLPKYEDIMLRNYKLESEGLPGDLKEFMDKFKSALYKVEPDKAQDILVQLYVEGKLPSWENVSDWGEVSMDLSSYLEALGGDSEDVDALMDLADTILFNYERE